MKLIKPSFEIIEQQSGLDGMFKQIELAGRTCYKSEDKTTETSAKEFVNRMIKSGHGAMLEHGTVYLAIPVDDCEDLPDGWVHKLFDYSSGTYDDGNTIKSPWIKVKYIRPKFIITTNYRWIIENGATFMLKYLCEPTEFHEKRITVRLVTDQGILREFTRHRTFSFAVESTRYCNYAKDKFGKELTFIKPCFLDDSKLALYGPYHTVVRDKSPESIFIADLNNAERDYLDLIESGWKPQEARNVLPLATKCEVIMTGFVDDWWGEYLIFDKGTNLLDQIIHGMFWKELNNIDREKYRIVEKGFFPLRCSNAAHPQAQELAIPLREEFLKRGYIK